MNEANLFAKFVKATCLADIAFMQAVGDKVYEEAVGENDSTVTPIVLTVRASGHDTRGNFGMRFKVNETYEIKAVVQGVDYSSLETPSNIIDRLFDWSNQIDPNTGRPVCQQVFTDPDDKSDTPAQIMIMSLSRKETLKYTSYARTGVNFSNLGGLYEVSYYKL